ncbi:sensor histidine kinase [Streptomyces flavofungini]|uniref:sensor histidine kinase n=1 Tax=Streptomyces flavofungini TaxID=68200 RepID=UPI0025AFEA69|nr:histidine kinase [Streptomyces flavofungini]WJV44361.1 histidine kinase [Streptomyces flavofungini]
MGRGAVRDRPGAADVTVPAVLMAGHVLALALCGVLVDGGTGGGLPGALDGGTPADSGASSAAVATWHLLLGALATAVAVLALVWRRAAPLPVFCVALSADGAAEALLPQAALTPALPCALWVALFSLAARGDVGRAYGSDAGRRARGVVAPLKGGARGVGLPMRVPVPLGGSPVPPTGSPAPLTGHPAPLTRSPVPLTCSPAPRTHGPAPLTRSPAPHALLAAALATAVLPLHGIPVPGTGDEASGPLLDDLLAGALLHLLIVLGGRLRHHCVARRARARARLAEVERERRAAAAAERERLARDLHDTAGHHLTAVAVQSAAALRLADGRPELAADALAAGAASGRDVLASLGRLVAAVGDEAAGGAPHESVPHLCAGLARLGFPVTRTAEGRPRPLPGVTSVAAYRIVQESLTNAMRYAAGAPVAVHLRHGAAELALTVVNGPPPGGTWADGGAPLGSGRGLAGMRERAVGVGGELTAGPTSEGGWAVEATLPVPGARSRTRGLLADTAAFALSTVLPLLLATAVPDPLLPGLTTSQRAALAALLTLHAAPLFLRRRAPATALAAMLTVSLGWSAAASLGLVDIDWLGPLALAWTAELTGLHAVGAYGPARVTWPAPVAVGLVGGLAVGLAVAGDPAESAGPGAIALLAALGLATVPWLLPVWALGLLARARRGADGPRERRLLDRVAARVGEAVAGERRRVATGLHATVVEHTVALVRHAEAGASGTGDVRTALGEVASAARRALAGLRELLDAMEGAEGSEEPDALGPDALGPDIFGPDASRPDHAAEPAPPPPRPRSRTSTPTPKETHA